MPALPSTSTSSSTRESTENKSNGPPTWFAATLAATSITAAVVIPGAIYLRRKKNLKFPISSAPPRRAARNLSLGHLSSIEALKPASAPPRRRQANTVGLDGLLSRQTPSTILSPALNYDVASTPSHIPTPTPAEPGKTETDTVADDFNPAFYTIRAFGLATFFVAVGAVTTVWGVKAAMGVENTEQFAQRMRWLVLTRMPILSSRIHRSHSDESDSNSVSDAEIESWNWQDAQQRLTTAFESDGLIAWAEAAAKEIEAEEKQERKRRRDLEGGL